MSCGYELAVTSCCGHEMHVSRGGDLLSVCREAPLSSLVCTRHSFLCHNFSKKQLPIFPLKLTVADWL